MKKLLPLLALLLLCGCGGKNEAIIDGTVTGVADGTTVYLLNNDREMTDSVRITNGAFRFEVKKAYPDMASLKFEGEPYSFPFVLEPGTITANVQWDRVPNTTFSGTDTNDRMTRLKTGQAEFEVRMREMGPRLMAMEEELIAKGETGSPEFDSLVTVYREIQKNSSNYAQDFLKENLNSIFAAYQLYSTAYSATTPAMMDSLIDLAGQMPENAFMDRLRERRDVLARTAVGQPAPDFSQDQPDGTPLSLSSLKGKLVLIDFWASWCGPCRAENPHVVKIYERFKDNGFEILGVSLDNSREDWLEAIEEDNLTWQHVSDLKGWSNAVAGQYAVRSIPHTVLVGLDGTILAKNLRGEQLEAKIAEVLDVD